MTDDAVDAVVRELWALGATLGRTPEPTPEVDPWEDTDAYEVGDVVAVVAFAGVPSVVVRLDRAGEDVVTIDELLDLDVPRRDTVAVVESVLTRRAWVELPRLHAVARWFAALLGSAFPASVHVPVPGGRVYSVQVPVPLTSGWLARLPVREGGAPDRRPGR